jgi:hypothetical protein
MRVAFIPWIALSVVIVASGEPIETITRDISLSERAHARSGAITVQRNSRVAGNVETGNGEIVLEAGSVVTGKLSSTTGTIRIDAARVGGLVSTTDGDIYIGADSRLDGGILVHKRNVIGLSLGDTLKLGIPVGRSTPLRVIIGPRATVAGALRFKREVKLLVSGSAAIGPVVGATPVLFATEQPPD